MPEIDWVARLLSDPPRVHADAPTELWCTEESCYRFMVGHVEHGSRTLETGIGLSTALFTAIGTRHTAVFPLAEEGERLASYCRDHGIEMADLELIVQASEDALPQLDPGAVDLFFIDGAHAVPLPYIDWFYGGRHVRRGGVVVLDDVQLPAVADVRDFLAKDPGWTLLEANEKWAGFRRESEGRFTGGWGDQPFLFPPPAPRASLATRLVGKVRRTLR